MWADGRTYVGEFKNDYLHGQGTNTWANGDKYVGEYRENKKHGQGTLLKADGTKKEGMWANGEFLYAQKDPATATMRTGATICGTQALREASQA
ncbi:MAG: hypothetical protein CMP95_08190 [Gammaproteobacteria bacterium]|nr:hypothetical protein [Gammaproteobacteria bacterium]